MKACLSHDISSGLENSPMAFEELISHLRSCGVVKSSRPEVRPLGGGVSSDIFLVRDHDRRFVVKRALEKLRVKDDWHAGPERNRYEQAYLRYADEVAPGFVPRVLHADDDRGFFAMEYLGNGWVNWKTELLDGRVTACYARSAATVLATIHRTSWGDDTLRRRFSTTPNFSRLRIDPYLITAGRRNPGLRAYCEAEAERLATASLALVHGDFSPKNILLDTATARIMLLDCEVAWFGDPVFDVAFFASHTFLKALYNPSLAHRYLSLGNDFLAVYADEMAEKWNEEMEARTARLLLLLLLARVDGKSPVEYLVDHPVKQQFVRDFVTRELPHPPASVSTLTARWSGDLASL